MRAGYGRTRAGAGVAVAVMLVLFGVGCGGGESDSASKQPAVSGTLTEGVGGEPIGATEIELVVRGAAMGSSGTAATSVDTVTTDASGAFVLDAAVGDLTPHAGADGRVQVEVRPAGAESGTITSVRLEKDRETGVTRVVETTEIVVAMQP